MPIHKMVKTKIFPRSHNMHHAWHTSIESATVNLVTNYPLIMYDEGKGTPASFPSNPEHASFVEVAEPNCYPDSKIDFIDCTLDFHMSKEALYTDTIEVLRGYFGLISMSFKEDYLAINDLTSEEIQDILMMEFETTDRQGFPLYNAADMGVFFTGSSTLAASVPGLT